MRAIEHVDGLARDTHLATLSERDERTALSTSGSWTERTSILLRTVAHARVMHLGRLFARRSATRMSNGRRATCPTVWLRVRLTRCRANDCTRASDRRRSWDSVCPSQVWATRAGERTFPFASRPRVRVCRRHSFPDRFRRAAVGARYVQFGRDGRKMG